MDYRLWRLDEKWAEAYLKIVDYIRGQGIMCVDMGPFYRHLGQVAERKDDWPWKTNREACKLWSDFLTGVTALASESLVNWQWLRKAQVSGKLRSRTWEEACQALNFPQLPEESFEEECLQLQLTGLLGLTECKTENLDNPDAQDYTSGSVAHFGKDGGLGGCWVSWPDCTIG